MPLKKMLKKRTQEKVGSNQSPRVEIDRAATLTCIVAIKKHSKSLNLIQTYHNSTTQNQQLFSRSGATQHTPNTTKHTESFTMERERERERSRSPLKFIPSTAYGKNSVYSIFFFGKNSAHLGQLKKNLGLHPHQIMCLP